MERDPSHKQDVEDLSAERAVERLASGWIPQDSAVADSGDADIREQLEAVALLAYELEPETPSPAVKQNLMAQIRGSRPQSDPFQNHPAAVEALRSPVDRTLQHAVADSKPVDFRTHDHTDAGEKTLVGYDADILPMRPNERPASMATWAMAAVLAFCLVGLGYLYGQVNAKNAVIALQQERLENAHDLESELEIAQSDLNRLRDSLAMVSTVAQTAYPLRPASTVGVPVRSDARGKVFVCGQHQRWYLSLNDLDPAPEGHEYHLWFMTEEGAVDAGRIQVENGVASMRDLNMPDGTQGFEITLEPVGGGEVPSGNIVLIGDKPVNL